MKSSKQNIAAFLYYYEPYTSGLSKYAGSIINELAKDNNVTVITSLYDKNLKKEETKNTVLIKRFPVLLALGKGVIAPAMIIHLIWNRRKYDKVLFFLPLAESGIVSLFLRKKQIYAFYVCDLNMGNGFVNKFIEKVSYTLARITLNKAEKIVPLSKDYFNFSKVYRDKYKDKVAALFPKTELEYKKVSDSEMSSYKKRLTIKNDDFVVGFLGRIVYEKGIDYLIDAVEILKQKIPNLKVIIGGDYKNIRGGSIYDIIKDKIEANNDVVTVTGFVADEDIPKFFSSLNVFVLPSIDPLEAFGIVQVEAMKYGVPVVASGLPGVREIVQKTGFGIISEPKSASAIAEAILDIYNNSEKLVSNKNEYEKFFEEKQWLENFNEIFNP